MLLLDVLFRYSTVALLLLIVVLVLRDGKGQATTRYAALVALSVAAMLLSLSPPELQLPKIPFIVIRLLDMPNIVFIWWLGLSMFQEDFKLGVREWTVFILYTGLMLFLRLLDFGVVSEVPLSCDLSADVLTFSMMAHLFFVTIVGRADDLIEPRRRLRLYFVVALVIGTIVTVLAENLFIQNFNAEVTLLRAVVAFPLTVWAFLWLTNFHPEKLSFQSVTANSDKKTKIDPRDEDLRKRLLDEMEQQKIFKQRNLTIRTLAERLNTPEHRLRVLINQGLGYRNFNDFLNHYRLQAIKQEFEQPDNARVPVLSIALEAGYNSLAPFNRAFLKAEGMTPSSYRKKLVEKLSRKKVAEKPDQN